MCPGRADLTLGVSTSRLGVFPMLHWPRWPARLRLCRLRCRRRRLDKVIRSRPGITATQPDPPDPRSVGVPRARLPDGGEGHNRRAERTRRLLLGPSPRLHGVLPPDRGREAHRAGYSGATRARRCALTRAAPSGRPVHPVPRLSRLPLPGCHGSSDPRPLEEQQC